jgi:hypothetical protein
VPPASAAELPPGEAARVWAGLERADADPLVVDLSLRALAAAARRAPLIYVLCSWVRIDYMASSTSQARSQRGGCARHLTQGARRKAGVSL